MTTTSIVKMFFYNFNTFPIVVMTQFFGTFPPQFSFGVVRIEIGNKLKMKIGFFKCTCMLGHPCHPYIQRHYRAFVIICCLNSVAFGPIALLCMDEYPYIY